jgi:hypothetical protein
LVPNRSAGIGDGESVVRDRIGSGGDDGKVERFGHLGDVSYPGGIPGFGGISADGEEANGSEDRENGYDYDKLHEGEAFELPRNGRFFGVEHTGCGKRISYRPKYIASLHENQKKKNVGKPYERGRIPAITLKKFNLRKTAIRPSPIPI